MRALSIRQPYAELILRGIKKIEYRSRPTRIIGERFYIYAARTPVGTPGSPGVIKDLRQIAGALDHSGRSRSGSKSVSYPGPNRSCFFSLCVLCASAVNLPPVSRPTVAALCSVPCPSWLMAHPFPTLCVLCASAVSLLL